MTVNHLLGQTESAHQAGAVSVFWPITQGE
jgi:hypothetical protein